MPVSNANPHLSVSIVQRLTQLGVVAILRTNHPANLNEAAQALLDGGIKALEITLTTPGACEIIQQLSTEFSSQLIIGSGSVVNRADALRTIQAGAQFVVTPVTRLEVVQACREAGVTVACGAYTPTEALTAHEAGADLIKIFPAESLGVSYFRSLLGPLPQLRLVPTGGVTAANAADFIRAGCVAVAAGSNLISQEILSTKNWSLLTERAQAYVSALQACGKGGY